KNPHEAWGGAAPRHSILGFWFVLANSFFAIFQSNIFKNFLGFGKVQSTVQFTDVLSNTEIFLKAELRAAFKNISKF
ncbi:MAG: hypothetical protein ACK400_05195, partial [Pseudanabaena sp.]